jgi:uncharacterized membrane protein
MTITTDFNTQLSRPKSSQKNSKTMSIAVLLSGAGLTMLGLSRRGWQRIIIIGAGSCLAYEGFSQMRLRRGRVRVSYTIARQPEEVHRFVRNSENWPKFIPALRLSPEKDAFVLAFGGMLGLEIRSHSKVTDEQEGKFIAWSSLPGMSEHRGVVRFLPAPGCRGTEVAVALEYKVPARFITEGLSMLRGKAPEQSVRETLRLLKEAIECGETATTTGQPRGRRGIRGAAMRALYREPQSETAIRPTQAELASD